MVFSSISFAETGQFSDLFLDYINGSEKLKAFYDYTPTLSSFKKAIEQKSKQRINRWLTAEVIEAQYKHISGLDPLVQKNIAALKENTTYTVCTGHQLCLFTGPLYFIYKIISTINLAEKLKKEYPENNFVPVYWMATEDHDFDEINHIHAYDRKIEWKKTQDAFTAGSLDTASLKEVIDELSLLAGDTEEPKKLIELFRKCYLNNKNLADATRALVNELFGQYGLVIVDGNDAKLKTEFREVFADDVMNHSAFKTVNDSIKALSKLGYSNQVNPREINIFLLIDGKRERIAFENGNFTSTLLNKKFSKDELCKYIFDDPAAFSPNVVLRPLYQQMILPNLAYVGGPGELAYWLEYKTMFDHYKMDLPVLMPRNFAIVLDAKRKQIMEKLGLSNADLFKKDDQLIKEIVLKRSGSEISIAAEQKEIEKIYIALAEKAERVDSTLKAAVQAEMQKNLNSLKNIEGKLIKAGKLKNETLTNQVKKIKDKLFPNAVLQERYDNFVPYYLSTNATFIDDLKRSFDPFKTEMNLIELN